MPHFHNPCLGGAGGQGGAYEIEQSLRFDGSSKLSRTPSSAGTTTTWTLSYWIKIGSLTAEQAILSANPSGGGYTATWYSAGATSRLKINQYNHPTNVYSKCLTPVYRDPSAWFHVVVVFDSTNATADDRVRFYVNGVRQTDFSDDGSSVGGTTNPSQNQASGVNHNAIHYIGSQYDGTYAFANSYLAEMHLLDGTAVTDALDFGEFDDNGVWRPIEYTGSYGTNGFYLKFDPSATNGIGHDHSGNGNNWTPSGFTTSGTGTDVMSDTPTNNFCTLNPLYYTASGIVQSEGNLKVTFPSAPPNGMRGGTLATTNAFYFEAEATAASSNQVFVGVQPPDWANNTTTYPGKGPDGWGYQASGSIVNNNSTVTTVSSWTAGDTIGVACHPSSGTIEFFKNGTSVYSGTSVANVPMTIGVAQVGGSGNSGTFVVNCGQRAFDYTPPTGFKSLNTSNLPAPEIADGSEYFNTVLYTGTGTTNPRTDVGFQPDLIWFKRRSVTEHHLVQDAIRGVTKLLYPSSTSTEDTRTDQLTSFDTEGFTLGADTAGYSNKSGTYVAWNWLAGNGTSTPPGGSIASTVSANPTAGFSIVSYTGTGTAGTVAHGLGVPPSFYVVKNRDGAYFWPAYHASLPNAATSYIDFDNSLAYSPGETHWNSTAPTSEVFSVNTQLSVNTSPNKYIAYCFAEIEGYSKFGKYVSNSDADGPFVFCSFKPELVWLKKTSGSSNWFMYDAARNEYNVTGNKLYVDSNAIENGEDGGSTTSNTIDILSNGFKLRTNNGTNNGGDYIFCAWAQNPFGGSGVSPATAR